MSRWFAAGALGLSLAAGCSHHRPLTGRNVPCGPVACANSSNPTAPSADVVPLQTVAAPVAAKPAPLDAATTVPVIQPVSAQAPTAALSADVAAVRTVPAPGTAKPAPLLQPASAAMAWSACDEGPASNSPNVGCVVPAAVREPPPAPIRKSAANIAACPRLGHAPDFSWICGQLEVCRHTKTWRLRYLAVDDTDDHGGSVTLTGTSAQLAPLREGQCIKVRGYLWNPDRKDLAPRYRVEAIERITNAN